MIVIAALITLLLTSQICGARRARWVLLGIVLTGCVVQAGVATAQVFSDNPGFGIFWLSDELKAIYLGKFGLRARGFYLNPNHLAWLLNGAAIGCVSLAAWGRVSTISRLLLAYLALVFVSVQILSASRGGMISLAAGIAALVGLGIVGSSFLRHGKVKLIGMWIAVGLVLAGSAWFAYSHSWLAQGRFESHALVSNVRLELYKHASRAFQTAPDWGIGAGMYRYAARSYRSQDEPMDAIYAHNDWIQILAEYGFFGLLSVVVCVGLVLLVAARTFVNELHRRVDCGDQLRSNTMALMAAGFATGVAYCTHGFFDFNLQIPANAVFAAFAIGLTRLGGQGGWGEQAKPEQRARSRWVDRSVVGFGLAGSAVYLAILLWPGALVDYRVLQASNALRASQCDEALAQTELALAADPQHAAAWAARGEAFFSYESALQFNDLDGGESEASENLIIDVEAPSSADGERADTTMLAGERRNQMFRSAAECFARSHRTASDGARAMDLARPRTERS